MNKKIFLIALIISLYQVSFADFPPTIYLKVNIILSNDASEINGYIVFEGYHVDNMNRNPQTLTIENKGPDSEYLEIIQASKKELKVFNHAGTFPITLYEYEEDLAFLSWDEFVSINSNDIEKFEILEIIIDRNFLIGFSVRSSLSTDEFWKYLTLHATYTINAWDYGGDCGGTVYDYSGNSEISDRVANMNSIQAEYYSLKESLSLSKKEELRDKWKKLFDFIIGAEYTMVVSKTCND